MKCYTIAQVVNYVNMHKDFFGITKERACWADCTGLFRVSKLSTQYNMQLFDFCKMDHTAQVFLPAAVKKSDLKKALNITKNTKFTDFFDITEQEWCFMQVTPNRMLVFDQIVKNTMPKVEQKPTEVEELKARIKELEGQLAQAKKAEPRVLTSYMTLDDDHVVHIDTNNPLGKLIYHYKLTANWFYDIDEAIDCCEKVALGLNTLCAELKRAKANGATHITYQWQLQAVAYEQARKVVLLTLSGYSFGAEAL